MKHTKKARFGLLLGLVCVFAAFGLLSACGINRAPTLTLDAQSGGTLPVAEYAVAEGEDLYKFLADKRPQPESGLTFAGWYSNGDLVENGDTMPATDLTLTAKYYADYTLSVYKEGEAGKRLFRRGRKHQKTGYLRGEIDARGRIFRPRGLCSGCGAHEGRSHRRPRQE